MRSRVELLAHLAAMMLLAWALLDAIRPAPAAVQPAVAEPDTAVLARWSLGGGPGAAHVRVVEPPAPASRDWLRALSRSGTLVTWSGDAIVPLAVSTEALADPRGGHRVRVAAPRGTTVVVEDGAGVLDTVPIASVGAELRSRALVDPVRARVWSRAAILPADRAGPWNGATTRLADPTSVRNVLVIGAASWEAKFAIAALEEAGWRVTARLAVAPNVWVEQGPLGRIDTARFSAVVVLDTVTGLWGGEIVRFVRAGGGVVLAGRAASVASLRRVAPGLPGAYVVAEPGPPSDSAPLRSLGVHPVSSTTTDALVLERRGPLATVAARRYESGRVVQVGYDDTWRWRMSGGDAAPDAHREWWTRVVTSVAHGRVRAPAATPPASLADGAPLAHLVDALGPPSAPPAGAPSRRVGLAPWVLPAATLLLLAGWASRRLRGAR